MPLRFSRDGDDTGMDMDSDADADMGMGDPGTNTSGGSMDNMPTSFHGSTTSSSSLWLDALTPSSPGAVVGACLSLVVLAIAYRLLHAVERLLVRDWVRQAAKKEEARQERKRRHLTLGCAEERNARAAEFEEEQGRGEGASKRRAKGRGGPSWWAGIDVPRGMYQILLSGVGYLLMLAIMTFNAYYFLSVLIGLGIGECIFGRYGRILFPSSSLAHKEAISSPSSSSGGFRSFSGSGSPIELDGTRLHELDLAGKGHEGGGASRTGGNQHHPQQPQIQGQQSPQRRPLLNRSSAGRSSTSSERSMKVEGTAATVKPDPTPEVGQK